MMPDFISTACALRTSCGHRQNDGRRPRNTGGFSLVSAIFLLVVLAALGVAMVSISTVQNQSSALDIQGVRAYQAARAGVEWSLYKYLQPSSAPGGCAAASGAVPMPATLSAFTVTVSCVADTGAGLSINNAVITVTACNNACVAGGSGFVRRIVQVKL